VVKLGRGVGVGEGRGDGGGSGGSQVWQTRFVSGPGVAAGVTGVVAPALCALATMRGPMTMSGLTTMARIASLRTAVRPVVIGATRPRIELFMELLRFNPDGRIGARGSEIVRPA
jgi:hypothetical protein